MNHMAVWMDHHEARIFHVDAQNFDEKVVEWVPRHVHRHPDADMKTHNHPDDEHKFFKQIIQSLAGAEQILVLGPTVTKVQFAKYAKEHAPAVGAKIVAVENADHPSDKQIVAHVRHHFHIDPGRRGVAG